MQVKPVTLLMMLVLILTLLTGCWSKVEVSDVAMVTAVGLDKTDKGKIQLSLELAVPRLLGVTNQTGGEKLETKAGWILSAEGETILEAYRYIQQKVQRKIVFYHSKVIVIGEKLARSGMLPVLDFFERYKQSQIKSHILFTKGEAVKILEYNPVFEKLSSEIMREEAKSKRNVSVRLLQFMDMMVSPGDTPMAARVQLLPAQIDKNSNESDPGSSQISSLSVRGAALFHKDQLIGWLNETETRGAMWLKNRMKDAVTTAEVPAEKGGGRISAQVHTAHTKYHTLADTKGITINVDTYAGISIFENTSKLDMSSPKDLDYVRALVADDVKARIELVCHKAQQEYKTDILGFGQIVYRQHPKQWNTSYAKEWENLFPEVPINIIPHISITQVGLTNKSIELE
ncbi:Ger(x)C family spore germination protein [Paenibacillus sp. GCM10012306]|uniref:Ger(x)C family spore germination protein n=1 Tax=Paenibacillus sp. GCM10012306 TaxID=3317342 RepID=UPI0036199B53